MGGAARDDLVKRTLVVLALAAAMLPACSKHNDACADLQKQHDDIEAQMNATDTSTNDGIAAYNDLVAKANAIRNQAAAAGCDVQTGF